MRRSVFIFITILCILGYSPSYGDCGLIGYTSVTLGDTENCVYVAEVYSITDFGIFYGTVRSTVMSNITFGYSSSESTGFGEEYVYAFSTSYASEGRLIEGRGVHSDSCSPTLQSNQWITTTCSARQPCILH